MINTPGWSLQFLRTALRRGCSWQITLVLLVGLLILMKKSIPTMGGETYLLIWSRHMEILGGVVDLVGYLLFHCHQEQDKLVAEMMRYILFKNHQHPGVPVKREELTQLVTKNYRQRNLPNLVILQTQKKFASIFGYEMKELQRARSSKNNSIRSSQQSTVEVKSYVLKSMLPEELRTRFVVDKDSLHLLGLTLAVVATLKLAGGKIPEDTLWQHLRRLGLDEHEERHPVFGNVKQAMETITKQRYIQTEKVSSPEGDITVYELAERALDEVVSTKVKESIMQIVKNGIPTTGASEAGS